MRILEISTTPWEKLYRYSCEDDSVSIGDYVVMKTEIASEIGKVINISNKETASTPATPAVPVTPTVPATSATPSTPAIPTLPSDAAKAADVVTEEPKIDTVDETQGINPIERKANKEDLEILLERNKSKQWAMTECRGLITKHSLPIKLVDVYFTFDDSRVTFAFIADGRVDFRELLKDLNKKFHKNIRLQQLGIRDEIKMTGDIGCCGRDLCCKTHLNELASITSDLADLQQVAHRGSDRLSGVCGRLKCCLLYEKATYDELADKLPLLGEKIKTDHGKGQVIGWHVLKQSVDVLLDDQQTIVEVPIEK
ncbi:signal peptidase [Candidatus Falkowbacteria bacterium]|jgi:cell fate regulator YaaT (PSP1 superfamily)|nr:signal peptidase [Candidatus Falkowbacteria bacterium]MBT7007472.1 signal peptidase [Candidatus Falkowbacteria bacterium]